MEYSDLYELIKFLEHGTNLHIGVVFLGDVQNKKCAIPPSHSFHSKLVCERIKNKPVSFERCFRCRNYALRKAARHKKPFGALCINGVYEYTVPVVIDGKVLAVIFIGNIYFEEGREKLLQKLSLEEIPEADMEHGFTPDMCDSLGRIIAGHIVTLIEKYPNGDRSENSLIENIKTYLTENFEYDLKISEIASLFHYNEVYLGRLFKKMTGKSMKQYINNERVKFAKELLKTEMNMTEIAKRAGFNAVSYFNRVFKGSTGQSPGEYKSRLAQE